MKIAIVCDWLVTYAGAERVLEQMLEGFPEADLPLRGEGRAHGAGSAPWY